VWQHARCDIKESRVSVCVCVCVCVCVYSSYGNSHTVEGTVSSCTGGNVLQYDLFSFSLLLKRITIWTHWTVSWSRLKFQNTWRDNQKPVQMNCLAYIQTFKRKKNTNIWSFYVQEVGIMTINDCLMPNIFSNVCVVQRVENSPISLDTRTRVSWQ